MFQFRAGPQISALSTRYVRCAVSATDQGQRVDPTASQVNFAFMQNGVEPTSDDWKTGSWEDTGQDYLARCLVGPDGVGALLAGTYTVWIKVVLAPETLIEHVGELTIY